MNRSIALVVIISVVVILILIYGFYFFTKPLYKPGELSKVNISKVDQKVDSSQWLMSDGVKISHFSQGSGDDILFIHGYPISPILEPIEALDELSNRRKIHYYHWRGCGLSDRPVERYSEKNFYKNMLDLDKKLGVSTLLRDIEEIRQILGKEKLTIIGHSYGGFLASLYAAEFPNNVEKLILIAPANVLKLPQDIGGLYNVTGDHVSDKESYKNWLDNHFDYKNIFTKSEEELIEHNLEFIPFYEEVSNKLNMPSYDKNWSEDMAGGWIVYAVDLSLGKRYDIRPFLKRIKAETLLIHGSMDVNSPDESKSYLDYIPNVNFKIINGAGHFPFNDKPDEFGKIITDFLK